MKKDDVSFRIEHEFDEFEPTKMELLRQSNASDQTVSQELRVQIVVVALEKRLLGIRIFSVREILKVPKMTWLPSAPAYFAGVIAVRGDVQAVVNLKRFLHDGTSHLTEQSRIILVEYGELVAGLLVDEMLDILDLPEQAILPLAESDMLSAERYFDGKVDWNGRIISLLNIEAIVKEVVVDQV